MHDPAAIEKILGRLMPPALSEQGQQEIEGMIRELAAETNSITPHPRRWWSVALGIAATVAISLVSIHFIRPEAPTAGALATAQTPADFILMSESGRVETITDEGWSESPDGAALRAVRLRVVEENRVFDEESGIVMNISQPREELLLMPVSAF